MARKKLVYLQLYTKDYTGDEHLRMCSPAAWGVYSYLLCLLNNMPIRGAYKMSALERRPDLKKSLTQRVLNASTDAQRLHPFAEILQRQMPWKKTEILKALKELFFYGVITIEGDMLIQPRMYRDGGHTLQKDAETATAAQSQEGKNKGVDNSADEGANNVPHKGTKKVQKKEGVKEEKSRVRVRANARVLNENMRLSLNNNNSVVVEEENEKEKEKKEKRTTKFEPPTLEEVKEYIASEKVQEKMQESGVHIDPEAFWNYYETNAWVQSRGKPIKNWRACVTTWILREKDYQNNGNKRTKTANDHTGVVSTADEKPERKKYISTI